MTSIKKIRNIIWLLFGKFGVVFFSIFTFIFFALYLTPEQLGKGALVIALVELVSVFFSSMLETPLVRKRSLELHDKSSVFWLGGVTSLIFSFLLIAVIYSIYIDENMWVLVAIGCIKFIFSNLSRTFIAQLRIERKFKALAIRTLIGKVIGASIAIICAYNGAGALSVVIQPVIMEAVSFIILLTGAGLPSWRHCRFKNFLDVIVEGYTYAIKFSCNSLLEKVTVIILGATTSLELVGYYTFARRLIELPRTAIQSAINTYSLPVFSNRISKGLELEQFFKEITFFTVIFFAPLFLWYGIIFSEIIVPIFGDKWSSSINIFLVLSVISIIRFLDIYTPAILAAHGQSQLGMLKEISNTLLCIVVVWIASSSWGLWGAVLGAGLYAILGVLIRYNAVNLLLGSYETLKESIKPIFILGFFGAICIYINLTTTFTILGRFVSYVSVLMLFIITILFYYKNLITRAKSLFTL